MTGAGHATPPRPLACDVGKPICRYAPISLAELENRFSVTRKFRIEPARRRVPRRGRLEVRVDDVETSEI